MLRIIDAVLKDGRLTPIVVIPGEGPMTQELRKRGVRCIVHSVTQWQAIYSTPLRFAVKKQMRKKAMKEEAEELTALLKGESIDLIHSNSSVIGLGAVLAENLHCRHIWHIREFSREHFGMEYLSEEEKVKKYFTQADAVVCISDALKDNYREKYPQAKVLRIYDGVEFPKDQDKKNIHTEEKTKQENEKNEKNEKRKFRFVYVGYFFPAKRQMDLLKAAGKLKKRGRTDFEIVLYGDGKKEYRDRCEKYRQGHCADVVEMPGFVENIPELLTNFDVGIIASEYEGFGLVTVEYMNAGLPVLGYLSGATPEIVKDGVSGFLYSDVDGLADKMELLMEDRDLRIKMGEAARKDAKRFGADENTNAVLHLYSEVMKGSI